MRKKLFSMLALLCLTAAGAWAQTEQTVDVTPVTGKTNQWTLAMPAGNVVLHVEYEPEFTATFKAANALTIEADKATVSVTENGQPVTTATLADGKLSPLYQGQTVILKASEGYKFRKVKAKEEGSAKAPAVTPNIAQADCAFSPSNGKSTLSNANITTSMEYSTDGGTTWTDVTSNGSIASLAAGTVQIRVKETDEKLASEAVSITVPQVLKINELVGPYSGDRLTCEYYAGETWQALVDRYDLIKGYSGKAAFGREGFIYYRDSGNSVLVTDLVDNTKTYEVQ